MVTEEQYDIRGAILEVCIYLSLIYIYVCVVVVVVCVNWQRSWGW